MAYRVADMGRGYDTRIQEKGEKLDDRIHVKEQHNFFSACIHALAVSFSGRPPPECDEPTAVYLLLICRIMIIVMRIATTWTKHVAVWFKNDIIFGLSFKKQDVKSKKLAWLEEQSSRYLNVPAVARRLDPLRRPKEWTYDESGGLANCVERPELNPHREEAELCGLFGFQ